MPSVAGGKVKAEAFIHVATTLEDKQCQRARNGRRPGKTGLFTGFSTGGGAGGGTGTEPRLHATLAFIQFT